MLETVPHESHKWPTVGDWRRDKDGTLRIRVSKLGNPKYELLVALHELIEVTLCEERGISCRTVDRFDKAFEAARKPGNNDEPGDDPKSPYRREHRFAENIERQLAHELGVDWAEYSKAIESLP